MGEGKGLWKEEVAGAASCTALQAMVQSLEFLLSMMGCYWKGLSSHARDLMNIFKSLLLQQ